MDRTAEEVAAPPSAVVDPALPRLLQLASSTLPVGAYSYSQGLESAVAEGWVVDAEGAGRWIGDHLACGLARFEAPLWWRLYGAWQVRDFAAVGRWNELFVATRDAAELRAETVQMGRALMRLARDAKLIDGDRMAAADTLDPIAWPTAFTLLAAGFGIGAANGLAAYLWSWIESQVLAAMKAVPLGQVAGQTLLGTLAARVPAIVAAAAALPDSHLNGFMPGLSIESCRHETQYSRIFRS